MQGTLPRGQDVAVKRLLGVFIINIDEGQEQVLNSEAFDILD